MAQVTFKFIGEVNDLLPKEKRGVTFTHKFKDKPSIKDTIESLGVPHTEVNVIIINEKSENFFYLLKDGDSIDIYSFFTTPKTQGTIQLQPKIPNQISFILDVHLGKLASFLRMLGFDSLYSNLYKDAEIADISELENRIVLTRDKGVLMRKKVNYGYYVRETNPKKQLIEVLTRFNLFEKISPFQRCLNCNGNLEKIDKQLILDQIPDKTSKYINQYYHCLDCKQIYWPGSHFQDMQNFIAQIISETRNYQN